MLLLLFAGSLLLALYWRFIYPWGYAMRHVYMAEMAKQESIRKMDKARSVWFEEKRRLRSERNNQTDAGQ